MPRKDLKRHLLEIRAGIHDEKILKPCKAHTDEQIIERYKCLVMQNAGCKGVGGSGDMN